MENPAAGRADPGILAGMSFEDLPETWATQPLTDPLLAADVVDLVVGHADRMEGCVGFLFLDDDLRLAQPCVLGEVPPDGDPWEMRDSLLSVFGSLPFAGVVFARGRDGTVLVTDSDRAWHEVVIDVCRRADLRVVGSFLATPSTVRPFPAPLTAVEHLAS